MAMHPMAPVDAAWYHMDGPANFALVTGILLAREPLDFEKVKAVYRERLARFDRFRQRVVESGFPLAVPHWEDVPEFDVGRQIHHIALPEPRDRAALTALVSDLASTPLDRERPLWEVHVVDDVDDGSAIVMRVHHCIGDGTAMLAVCQELFDATPAGGSRRAPLADERVPTAESEPESDDEAAPDESWFAPALSVVGGTARAALAAVDATLDALRRPQQTLDRAQLVLDGAGMLFDELMKPADPRSPLKGDFGMQKRVAWSEPIALAQIKAIGAPSGAKINDVLVAGMTGALRAYLAGRGIDVRQTTVRAMVPVDLRPPGRGFELGNEFGLVVLDLAVQNRLVLTRLRQTRERMDALKRSAEPVAIMALFNLFGRVPKSIEDIAVDLFGSKASVVMTNVAGPGETLYLAGVPLDRMIFWVPHPGRQLGMGISIMSYRGYATLGVVADARLVPDPEAITAGFHREFERMAQAVERQRDRESADARGAAKPSADRRKAKAAPRGRHPAPRR